LHSFCPFAAIASTGSGTAGNLPGKFVNGKAVGARKCWVAWQRDSSSCRNFERGSGDVARPGPTRLVAQVTEIQPGNITLESGEEFQGDAVVVATDASAAEGLVSAGGTATPVWRSVTCLYFAAASSPLCEAIIALNSTGSGLVNNVCVPSDLAPDYAPPSKARSSPD